MSKHTIKLVAPLVALVALFCALASTARADSLVITSGSVRVGGFFLGSFAGASGSFAGGGFNVRFVGGDEISHGPAPCQFGSCGAGQVINMTGGTIRFNTFPGSGFITVGGLTYNPALLFSTMQLTMSDVVLPDTSVAAFTLSTSFSLSGDMGFSGALTSTSPFVTLFQGTVSGQGTMLLNFERVGSGYTLSSYDFQFGPAAATPEPASLVLLGTGIIGAVAARRRKRTGPASGETQ